MKICDNRQKIINLVRLLMQGGVVLENCEPVGSFTMSGRTAKKKCQSIKGSFGLPHDCIEEKIQENVNVIRESFVMPFAIIPDKFSSIKSKELSLNSKKYFDDELKKYPKIEQALNNLMQAIKDELGN